MKHATIVVQEKFTYTREIEIEVPDEMSERDFERLLTYVEQRSQSAGDLVHELRRRGIEQNEPWDDDMRSPDEVEVECTEYDFPEDQGEA